jgi:hypothetical protein
MKKIAGGQSRRLGSPPGDPSQDWIAVLERLDPPVFKMSEGQAIIEAEHAVASHWIKKPGI